MNSDSTIRGYYAARASEYDDVYRKPERQADLRGIEAWLPPLFADRMVLEVACGTGYWTQFIVPNAEHIVGIVTSVAVLKIARTRVSSEKVTFRVADAYDLPQHLGFFTAVFAGFWFSHVPTREREGFLRHLHAFLATGATVVLLDNLYVAGSSSEISDTDSHGDTFQMRRLKEGSLHRVLKNFPSQSELEETLQAFGYRGIFTTWDYYWAFQYTI